MPLLAIRKTHAGSDSYGNTWDHDGDVLRLPLDQAHALLAIPDGGFTDVTTEKTPMPAPTPAAVLTGAAPTTPVATPAPTPAKATRPKG